MLTNFNNFFVIGILIGGLIFCVVKALDLIFGEPSRKPAIEDRHKTILRRCAAFVIDCTLSDIAFIPFRMLVEKGAEFEGAQLFYSCLFLYAYHIAMVGLCGQTFGKMMVQVKVISTDTGDRPSWRAAVERELPWILSVFIIPFVGFYYFSQVETVLCAVSIFALFWSQKRRTLHDWFAHTEVVRCFDNAGDSKSKTETVLPSLI